MPPLPANEDVQRLARQLGEVCQQHARLDETERAERVRASLDEALSAMPTSEAPSMLEGLRSYLIARAEDRESRLVALEDQVAALESRVAASESEARSSRAQVDELRRALEQARSAESELESAREAARKATALEAELANALEAASRATALEAELEEARQAAKQADEAQAQLAEARRAQEQAASARTELEDARRALEQSRGEADDLQRRLSESVQLESRLREEISRLEQRVASKGPPPPPVPGSDAMPADAAERSTLLERMRDGLRRIAGGENVAAASLELPPDVQQLFELMERLLRFSLEFDQGVQAFLMELQVGPAMDTVQMRGYQRQVQQRFCDCLDNKDGAVDALADVLDRNRRFLILLNEAYRTSIPRGCQDALATIAPQEVLAKTKGKGLLKMTNYEAAFKQLATDYEDLANLPPTEILVRFFTEPFQDELRRRTES